ncbi:MAG: DnaD domain protein [Lachnospira pectinoschiza]
MQQDNQSYTQPSFEYADTILANWKNSNVSSLEDVKKADAAYAARQQYKA